MQVCLNYNSINNNSNIESIFSRVKQMISMYDIFIQISVILRGHTFQMYTYR